MKCSRSGLKGKVLGVLLLSALSTNVVMAAPTFQEAVSDYNSGKYARALGTLKHFKAQFPNNPLVHYNHSNYSNIIHIIVELVS